MHKGTPYLIYYITVNYSEHVRAPDRFIKLVNCCLLYIQKLIQQNDKESSIASKPSQNSHY